jgi:hypothetical protein
VRDQVSQPYKTTDTEADLCINISNGTVEVLKFDRYSSGQEISCFYGMQSSVTVFTKFLYWTIIWASWIH